MTNQHRLLNIISHPIQYYAPLLRLIAQSQDIKITALFYWDKKQDPHFDEGFGRKIEWDVPLLSGYPYFYLNELANSTSKIKKLKALWKLINKKNYDIVWTHGYSDLYTLSALVIARLRGLKTFVRGDSALFPDEKKTNWKSIKRKFFFLCLRSFVDRFLAVGTENKLFYETQCVPASKIILSHYAVDNDYFYQKYLISKNKITELKLSLQLDPDRLVILYASKFIKRKYPIDLLHAYFLLCENKTISKPYLLFIGTGETLDEVKAEAAKDSDGVRFLGFKNQSELPDYFALADILALPAKRENWGLVVNEAMNAECALVLSDEIACAPDLLIEGVNGYSHPARDVKKLAACLEKLATDRALCEKMKLKSRDIISHWGLSETVAGLRQAFQSVK